jgi:hypothetical protein
VSNPLEDLAKFAMRDDLERAIKLLQGLMAWAPDDLAADEMPAEWTEAQEFLAEQGWV